MTDDKKSTDRSLSVAERKTLRGHEARAAIADHEPAQKAFNKNPNRLREEREMGPRVRWSLPHPSYRTICRSNASYFPPGSRTLSEEPDLKTVGEVREISGEALTSLPDFGRRSLSDLRMKLGLPSTHGVRPIRPT